MAGFVKSVLENAGIRCTLKNYYLSGAMGDLPINETWPEIWVKEEKETCALALIRLTLETERSSPEWVCPQCRERLEGQFKSCWNCGYEPGSA